MENLDLSYLLVILIILLLVSFFVIIRQRSLLKQNDEGKLDLIKQAYFDPETELPNRKNIDIIIEEQISRTARHGKSFLILTIQINNYNIIMKESKVKADNIAIEVGNRLLNSIRDEDMLARISEDKFVIVYNEYLEPENETILIERIKVILKDEFIYNDSSIDVEILIGTSKFPEDAKDSEGLITNAIDSSKAD